MKSILTSIGASALLAALATAQPRYTVIDLDAVDGFSQATFVTKNGIVTGVAAGADGTQHAMLWYQGWPFAAGVAGLGGPNTGAFGANRKGQVIGQAESSDKDPNNENFCGYGTGLKCLPTLLEAGTVTPLATLGGNNGSVGQINNRGEVAGFAENSTRDPACPTAVAVNGTGPQVLDFEAVIWGPGPGQIRVLAPPKGDSVGMALGINDNGQAVGATGTCANTVIPGFVASAHAVLWEPDGSVRDLGNLGGTSNPALLAVGNAALAINNQSQVTGTSALAGNTTNHAFLWTGETGMQDLGTLPGDVQSAGLDINEGGDVVGASISAPGASSGNPRAFLWHNGVMMDLNALTPEDSPLYLLTACVINDAGDIVGFGATSAGDIHAFLATPVTGDSASEDRSFTAPHVVNPVALSEKARAQLRGKLRVLGK